MTPKQLQTWLGKAIAQLGLHSGKAPRKNGKRAYRFDLVHVNDIFSRFTQISGQSGDVVNEPDNNDIRDTTDETVCGQTWSGSGQDRKDVVEDTTSDHIGPHGQTVVVDDNSLNNHSENHQTTQTTGQTEAENNTASNMKPKVVNLKPGQQAEKVGRI
jgi:hypothetical protein